MVKKVLENNQTLHDVLFNLPDNLTLSEIIAYTVRILDRIWHYPLINVSDNQTISLSNIIIATALLFFGIRVAESLSRLVRKRFVRMLHIERNVAQVIEKISYYIFILIISFLVLDIANVPLKAFTFVGGALAIGLGFGSKQVLENFISGLIIMIEQPIRIGDIIELQKPVSIIGTVVNIGARCTHVLTGDNIDIIVPNSDLLQETIVNLTLTEEGKVRHAMEFRLPNDNDPKKVEDLLFDIIYANQNILKTPLPQVFLSSLNDGVLTYKAQFWVNITGPMSRSAIVSQIHYDFYRAIKENNLNLGNPYYNYGFPTSSS
ncbi:MAG: mechanosensitive ion channel [Sphingobacteriia bacterium]|nr:mechanosensitive ion channel [Sphingobacteriia bacterium]